MVGRHGNTSVLPSTRSETASAMSETAVAILGRALAELEDIAAVTGWARENSPPQETGEYGAPLCSRASMNTAARTLIFGGAGFIGGPVAPGPPRSGGPRPALQTRAAPGPRGRRDAHPRRHT